MPVFGRPKQTGGPLARQVVCHACHGLKLELPHVVAFIAIERVLHHTVMAVDWVAVAVTAGRVALDILVMSVTAAAGALF